MEKIVAQPGTEMWSLAAWDPWCQDMTVQIYGSFEAAVEGKYSAMKSMFVEELGPYIRKRTALPANIGDILKEVPLKKGFFAKCTNAQLDELYDWCKTIPLCATHWVLVWKISKHWLCEDN